MLRLPPSFRFRAGQYVEIDLGDGLGLPLSVASAPHRLPELHLHYRSTPGVAEAGLMDDLLKREGHVTLGGPFGTVCLPEPLSRPLLMVAGGTGAAQAMGLLDELLAEPPAQPVTLLWGADRPEDLYRAGWLQSLACHWLTSECIVDPSRDGDNEVLQWLQRRAPQLGGHEVILSGSPGFVYAVADVLELAGLPRDQLSSDVFAYAPREAARQPSDRS